jgi:hypothetical protein
MKVCLCVCFYIYIYICVYHLYSRMRYTFIIYLSLILLDVSYILRTHVFTVLLADGGM